MNYDWLFSFTRFAQHLNFTKAAAELFISQPALHVQIRKLTEAVGRPLYRRRGRALFLTTEGQRLAAYGRETLEQSQAILEELRGESHQGPVILASGQGAFLYLLGPAIRRFPKERWPLRLLSMSGPDAIEAVRDAKAHICVVATDEPPTDLNHVLLRAVGQQVVVPRAHRLAKKHRLAPTDLKDEPIVVAPSGSPHRTMLQALWKRYGLVLNVAVEASGWELMIQFARYNVGVAVVNDSCVLPKGLVGIPLPDAPQISYQLITRNAPWSEGVNTLRNLIEKSAAQP